MFINETSQKNAFQLKGSMFTLTMLQLISLDLEQFNHQLNAVIRQAPKLFQNAPIVLDLSKVSHETQTIPLTEILNLMREYKLYPVGIQGGSEMQQEQAHQLGLAWFSGKNPTCQNPITTTPAPTPTSNTLLITQPVRSGQQIYAKEGDLVVVSSVSHGAELLADGNIHVYGTLRGKALAGISGNKTARIFCNQLDAELLAIAGIYQLSEDFEVQRGAKYLQIYLDNERLQIAKTA